ncbi:hypothetical protein ASG43_12220 [Aureimonas sp. Leaf454]|uniref:hypothetical protein n=1 Tax=Aureimonas sp. Leaf454 TaxID=1736381 RepID=UPI0006F74B0E|nr:hypothetical protein [Aureimonas sp. Leaf454]KQT45067.1 hypothetical protein ASG43_12220 [Aureimonas sp. Leaf454]
MLKFLRSSLLAAGALSAASLGLVTPSFAAAEGRPAIAATADADMRLAQRYDDRYDDRRDRRERRYDRDGVCAPGQALRKASRLGLRRPEVVRDTRRGLVVDGFKRGRLVSVRFAQERGCPVLGVR